MPPVRRKNVKGISNRCNRSQSTAANSDTESLQRQCTERGLPNHGKKNAPILLSATTARNHFVFEANGRCHRERKFAVYVNISWTWKPTIFVI